MRNLFIVVLTVFSSQLFAGGNLSDKAVYHGIQETLEKNLFTMAPRVQGHYGIRMYRQTGESRYLSSALYDFYVVQDHLNYLVTNHNVKGFVSKEAQRLTDAMSKGKRGNLRRKSLKQFPEFIYYADAMLRYSARLNEFGEEIPQEVITAISQYDFLTPLTDKTMIHAWAAQLANYVYWLKQLGIADYSKEYKTAFNAAYPDSQDGELSKSQFKNKLYGLTHFVFAASSYYQEYVSEEEFDWILVYFQNNEKRIFKEASADIIAEVGISHLLIQSDHPLLRKTQNAVKKSYDTNEQFIPSISGKIEYSSGEHRNVLAMMLLNWQEKLHPGPLFSEIKSMKSKLPMSK